MYTPEAPPPELALEPALDRTGHRAIRVLIVEDSPDHRTLMQRQLHLSGVEVTAAETGEAALEVLRSDHDFDLVLLDYKLPRMSGLDIIEQLSMMPTAPSVILITAMGSADVAVQALRAGAIDYLTKSSGYLDALPEVVERAWRQHDLRRRANELQRLAVLVNSVIDREGVMREVVEGAMRLLDTDACALFTDEGDGLEQAALAGNVDRPLAERIAELGPLPTDGSAVTEPGFAMIAIVGEHLRVDGWLVLVTDESRVPLPEEVRLSQAFASFAALALRNLRRRELEEKLIAELQQTIAARRDFVASVSHELRTPLTSIGGFSETILERWDQIAPEMIRDLVTRVYRHSQELSTIVEQLIDVAGHERGRTTMEVEPLDLLTEVEAGTERVSPVTAGRRVHIDVPANLAVMGQSDGVREIIANFVANAVKFSAADQPVEITAVLLDGTVRVSVTDRGIGLAPSEAEHVFEPFWRAGYAVRNAVRGAGVGLALVREYARGMAGEVGVESVLGEGATFWFTLPSVSEQQADPRVDEGTAAATQ